MQKKMLYIYSHLNSKVDVLTIFFFLFIDWTEEAHFNCSDADDEKTSKYVKAIVSRNDKKFVLMCLPCIFLRRTKRLSWSFSIFSKAALNMIRSMKKRRNWSLMQFIYIESRHFFVSFMFKFIEEVMGLDWD